MSNVHVDSRLDFVLPVHDVVVDSGSMRVRHYTVLVVPAKDSAAAATYRSVWPCVCSPCVMRHLT